MSEIRRLYRSRDNHMVGGVAAGVAEYFSIDPTIVRLLWLLLFFAGGSGLLLYIAAWIIIPERPGAHIQDDSSNDQESQTIFEQGEQVRQHIIDAAEDVNDGIRKASAGIGDPKSSNRTLGWVLVIIGVFFLFRHALSWISFEFIWPFAVIGLGIYLVIKAVRD